MKPNTHGGSRLNAGRKTKDPDGPVVRVVTWISAKQAKYFADRPHLNRTDEIKKALDAQISGEFSWISVEDRPLIVTYPDGVWMCTEDVDKEFIAAVPYTDKERPDEKNLWWIRHCVVEDGVLCIVGDSDNEVAGWELEDVAYWRPWVAPPPCP